MAGNIFGNILRLTTFGESHSDAVGGVIDGFPSNIEVNYELLKNDINRRKTGGTSFNSKRLENDEVSFLSGIFNGRTLGTPIAFIVKNIDAKSEDYENNKHLYRPSHADYTTMGKFGIRDYRGGGRASARETLARVIAGSFAKMFLEKFNIHIRAYVSQIGSIALENSYSSYDLKELLMPPLFCPDKNVEKQFEKYVTEIKKLGDTVGGRITCVIKNTPLGLGEPVFDKLQAQLAYAMMGIPAVKGFEYGSGFKACEMKGSENNDAYIIQKKSVRTITNHSGGIQGGISNGEDIYFNVAFKPVSSINKPQNTVSIDKKNTTISITGRHDACPVPRAVPIVEAMSALVIADNILLNSRLNV